MERTINIIGTTGIFDIPTFPLVENDDLRVKLNFINFARYGKWYLTVNCGEATKTFIITETEDSVTIPSEWIKESNGDTLEFILQLRNTRGDKVISGGYFIEPLILQETPSGTQATALLQSLRAEIAELQKTIEDEKATKAKILKKLNAFVDNGVDINFNED